MAPDFLIIGAAKAATTALSSMLDQHPQAGIVDGKEPHFFSMDAIYAQGWNWYQSEFQRCKGKAILGDASTSYSRVRYHPQVISRIKHHVPNVKIIYMVRHPLDRIVSAYVERLATIDIGGDHYPSVNHAVKSQPQLIDSSRYWEVYDYYRRNFAEDNIKIVWFEDFIRNVNSVFQDVCRFLGIEDTVIIDPKHMERRSRSDILKHLAKTNPNGPSEPDTSWDPETRQWVLKQIRYDNLRLLRHFKKPEDYWAELSDP